MIEHRFSRKAAISLVVANMIGTGVFTSLGFQLVDIRSVFALMMLWFVGGIAALCGALTYAELGANLPRSGGEYNFLTRLYHPSIGFISGWISITVGFAAPIALAAMTFGAYLSASVEGVSKVLAASLLVVALTVLHCFSRKASGGAQIFLTVIKVLLILVFCILVVIFVDSPQPVSVIPTSADADILFGGAFAVSLIYVNYAYTGWNAATYITSELDDPQRSLPMVLFVGTSLVLVIYLALNFIFLYTAPMDSMQGKIEIGVIVAETAFGQTGGKAMGIGLALLLTSTVSAMIISGPRVLQVIGEDFAVFGFLSSTNKNGVPTVAIVCLGTLSVVFILTATFESILVFSGFILGVNTLFTVIGVFVLRWRKLNIEGAYRTFGYPITPIIYLLITLWTLSYILINRPDEGWAGIAMIVTGFLMYFVSKKVERYQIETP
ncbi:MAG: amino acid permease [Gammaproteobacteria bacterium]|nr:amino acid permease [Gammaproteobacteria bacterium]